MNRASFLRNSVWMGSALFFNPAALWAWPEYSNRHVRYYSPLAESYNDLRAGFNSRINKHPVCIAVCHDVQGVQQAIKLAAYFHLAVSVKSGGHCMEGLSCGEGSMQIIVSGLNKISWLNEQEFLTGPGVRLFELYESMIPRGRILPGGSCATVGIGGLTLGGGYGILSRQFGLTCDHLKAVEMVDGSGRIRRSEEDRDLLWACKGGGSGQLGIITQMHFKTERAPKQLSSYRFRTSALNAARAKEQLKAWFHYSAQLPGEAFSAFLFNGNHSYILLTNTGKEEAVRFFIEAMKPLHDRFSANRNTPLAQALKNYYGQPHPTRFKNASAGLYRSWQDVQKVADDIIEMVLKNRGMIFQWNTAGGNIQNERLERESCFPHRSYPYFSELQCYWDDEVAGKRLMQRFVDLQTILKEKGFTDQYRNYPALEFENYAQQYYGKYLARLQELKQRYDPGNVIRHEQSIRGV
ncbi:MAG TPA: FAD-binding oxidoreductase [Chitinophagaceae bacterium]|nr:FAD-binding oxidoreductase [Chitinophagaceae bacterium]